MKTKIRIFFLKFLCNCKNKLYFCITKTSLSYGVMVTQQILVLLFLVRIQVAQQNRSAFRGAVFVWYMSKEESWEGRCAPAVCPSGVPQRRPCPSSGHLLFWENQPKAMQIIGVAFGVREHPPGSFQPIKNRDETARCSGPFRPFASVGPAGTPGRPSCYSCLSSCMRSISARVSGLWPRKRT